MYVAAYVDQEKCIGCKTCIKVCPEPNAIIYHLDQDPKKKGTCSVVVERCKGCGLCATNCPKKCIELKLVTQKAA
ncbi:MAG: 4Fe-4S dicluster domain-containing protein [Desulfobulbaceae bacterium]|nr:MAG: 4Fe-4S dicluster domain-containing protein [Desulfobulbaceae bacterium]